MMTQEGVIFSRRLVERSLDKEHNEVPASTRADVPHMSRYQCIRAPRSYKVTPDIEVWGGRKILPVPLEGSALKVTGAI